MNDLPVGGRVIGLGEAAIDAIMGFAVVFAGISILILVVSLVGYLFTKINAKKTETATEKPTVVAEEISSSDDEELAVVISAAIAAYYGEKKRKPEFKVKNLRR